MVSKLATYISDLLYDHDAVIVPNFGGFVTNYKPSSIDHVQGIIYPPSKSISFNDNLVVNDGVLINHVRKELNLSAKDARKMVENFVTDVKNSIVKREIVVFPGVGRLYLDYESKIQFLPDNTNYNTEVYGLPSVQYYPILRTRDKSTVEAPAPALANVSSAHYEVERAKRQPRWANFRTLVPYLIIGAVFLSGIGIYKQISNKGTDLHFREAIHLPVNVKPKPNLNIETNEVKLDEDDVDNMMDEEITDESSTKEKSIRNITKAPKKTVIDTEGATVGPNIKTAVIIVHAFGDKDNVRKMTDTLIKEGENPYADKTKSLTRVGVKYTYESERQLQDKLKYIQKTFSKRAYIHTKQYR